MTRQTRSLLTTVGRSFLIDTSVVRSSSTIRNRYDQLENKDTRTRAARLLDHDRELVGLWLVPNQWHKSQRTSSIDMLDSCITRMSSCQASIESVSFGKTKKHERCMLSKRMNKPTTTTNTYECCHRP
jgi:hypothetical protein